MQVTETPVNASQAGKDLNRYGVLITVFSLLMIVQYSEAKYDAWDLTLSAIATYFGICAYRQSFDDLFLLSLSAAILAVGCISLVFGAISLFLGVTICELAPFECTLSNNQLEFPFVFVVSLFLIAAGIRFPEIRMHN